MSNYCATRRPPFHRKVPYGPKGRTMANSLAKCSNCKGYFPQPSFFYSNSLQRFCTDACFSEAQQRKSRKKNVKVKGATKTNRSTGPKIPVEIRFAVRTRDGSSCRWCGRPGQEVHHIHYRSEGGANELSNLILLCVDCHSRAHSSKEAYKPLLLATLWIHYVEGKALSVPSIARLLKNRGLLTPLQEKRMGLRLDS